MKIVVVFGEDTKASHTRFVQIINGVKRKGFQLIRLGKKDSLINSLRTNTLFPGAILYVHDDATKISDKELSWLLENHTQHESSLLMYHKNSLNQTFLKKLPSNVKKEEFKITKTVFNMLDNLYPGNSKTAIKMLHQAFETENPEFVFALIAKQFRDLYWVMVGEETLDYPAWRKNKLLVTSKKFTEKKLKKIIEKLAEIDYKSKTSDVNTKLLLDMLLMEALE